MKNIRNSHPLILEEVRRALTKAINARNPIDVGTAMEEMTLRIVMRSAFGFTDAADPRILRVGKYIVTD